MPKVLLEDKEDKSWILLKASRHSCATKSHNSGPNNSRKLKHFVILLLQLSEKNQWKNNIQTFFLIKLNNSFGRTNYSQCSSQKSDNRELKQRVTTWWFTVEDTRVLRRFSLPRFSLPRFSLPRFSLPRFSHVLLGAPIFCSHYKHGPCNSWVPKAKTHSRLTWQEIKLKRSCYLKTCLKSDNKPIFLVPLPYKSSRRGVVSSHH